MRSRGPALTLILLLAVAVATFVAGVLLSRRSQEIRETRDREPSRQFSGMLSEEIERLDRHFESHLRRIARFVKPHEESTIRNLGSEIVGLRQVSILQTAASPHTDVHVSISLTRPSARFFPTFGRVDSQLSKPSMLLDEEGMMRGTESAGWVNVPAHPPYFWVREGETAVVFLIDRSQIAAAIDRSLVPWSRNEFASVRLVGGPDRLIGASHAILSEANLAPADPDRPDFLIPIRGRFGTWQIASWDRVQTQISYDLPTLIGAAILGAGLVLIAALVSSEQRRAFKLAAQRVSFVNQVSHELRAPMTNILLNLDLVAEASPASGKGASRIELVREEAQRLGRMIENVLTFARGEQNKLKLQPRACVPDQVIEAVLEQFRASFTRRQIQVEPSFSASSTCLLDADALAQIAANLLSNVEKYAPSSTVTLRTKLEHDHLLFTVADTGAGIPPQMAARIFEPFERIDSRITEGVTGAGLGLAIGRELAHEMGGALELMPSVRGANFQLRVPAPKAPGLTALPAA